MFTVISQAQSRLGTTTHGSATLQLEPGESRKSGTGSRQNLQGQGGATGRAALGVTQKPIPWSQGMIFPTQPALPRFRAVPQWCGSTRGQRGEDAAAARAEVEQASASRREAPAGLEKPPGFRTAIVLSGNGTPRSRVPVRRAGRAPRAFARPRSGIASLLGKVPLFAALTAGPQRGRSSVPPPSRGAPLAPARTPPLPPPLRVPRDSRGASGHRLRIAAGMGREPEAHPSQGSRGERAAPGPQGSPQGWRDRPRHRRPLPAPPPPAGRRLPWRRINSTPRDRLRGSHGHGAVLTASHGEPRPAPSRGDSAAALAQRRQPRRAFLPRQRPPAPPGTAIGHRPRAPAPEPRSVGPPCAVPAATSAPPVQAKLHPVKLSPL